MTQDHNKLLLIAALLPLAAFAFSVRDDPHVIRMCGTPTGLCTNEVVVPTLVGGTKPKVALRHILTHHTTGEIELNLNGLQGATRVIPVYGVDGKVSDLLAIGRCSANATRTCIRSTTSSSDVAYEFGKLALGRFIARKSFAWVNGTTGDTEGILLVAEAHGEAVFASFVIAPNGTTTLSTQSANSFKDMFPVLGKDGVVAVVVCSKDMYFLSGDVSVRKVRSKGMAVPVCIDGEWGVASVCTHIATRGADIDSFAAGTTDIDLTSHKRALSRLLRERSAPTSNERILSRMDKIVVITFDSLASAFMNRKERGFAMEAARILKTNGRNFIISELANPENTKEEKQELKRMLNDLNKVSVNTIKKFVMTVFGVVTNKVVTIIDAAGNAIGAYETKRPCEDIQMRVDRDTQSTSLACHINGRIVGTERIMG